MLDGNTLAFRTPAEVFLFWLGYIRILQGSCNVIFGHGQNYLLVAGWWFGTCFIFPCIWNNNPTDFYIFQMG